MFSHPDWVAEVGEELGPDGDNVLHQRLETVRPLRVEVEEILLELDQPGPAVGSLKTPPGLSLEIVQLPLHFVSSQLAVKDWKISCFNIRESSTLNHSRNYLEVLNYICPAVPQLSLTFV